MINHEYLPNYLDQAWVDIRLIQNTWRFSFEIGQDDKLISIKLSYGKLEHMTGYIVYALKMQYVEIEWSRYSFWFSYHYHHF